MLALPLLLLASTDGHWPSAEVHEVSERWQGSWVVRDADYDGSVQAWTLEGDRLTVYDARRQTRWQERFALSSSCSVVRTRDVGSTGAIVSVDTFAFAGDGLHVARAPAGGGIRVGSLVTACARGRVYTFDATTGRCQARNVLGAETTGRQAPNMECAIVSGDVAPSFVLRPLEGGTSVTLSFYGDALLSTTLAANVAEPEPSFAAAVARADAVVSR